MREGTRFWLIVVAGVLVAFLAGFAWQRIRANGIEAELQETAHALAVQQIESTLGAAAIEAQAGSYEIARQHASEFFTRLQGYVDSVPAATQPAMRELLARRDALITALSRSDPQSGPQLAQMFVRYRAALGEPVGPTQTVTPVRVPQDTSAPAAADTASPQP